MKCEGMMRKLLGKWLTAVVTTAVVVVGFSGQSQSAPVFVTVTIRNVAPVNSVSFAPLRLGFGNGTFDAFNINQSATAPIISVAEGGSGSAWFPAFQAAEPNAVLGSVGGALTPGSTASNTFLVDSMSANNRFFTFASMVIPSNDLFIGNDNPSAFQLFDATGNLLISQINQNVGQIWDAGSEAPDPANAAFVVGGNNNARTPQNGFVTFSSSELGVFNGLQTAAGYTFTNAGIADPSTRIYEIGLSVTAVPEPSSMILGSIGLGSIVAGRFWRRKKKSGSAA